MSGGGRRGAPFDLKKNKNKKTDVVLNSQSVTAVFHTLPRRTMAVHYLHSNLLIKLNQRSQRVSCCVLCRTESAKGNRRDFNPDTCTLITSATLLHDTLTQQILLFMNILKRDQNKKAGDLLNK